MSSASTRRALPAIVARTCASGDQAERRRRCLCALPYAPCHAEDISGLPPRGEGDVARFLRVAVTDLTRREKERD